MFLNDRVLTVIGGQVYSSAAYYILRGRPEDADPPPTPMSLRARGVIEPEPLHELWCRVAASPLRYGDPALWSAPAPWEKGAPSYAARYVRDVW